MFRTTTFVCTHKGNVPTSTAASKLLDKNIFRFHRQPRAFDFGTCTIHFHTRATRALKTFHSAYFSAHYSIFSFALNVFRVRNARRGTYTLINMTDYDTLNSWMDFWRSTATRSSLCVARAFVHHFNARFKRVH